MPIIIHSKAKSEQAPDLATPHRDGIMIRTRNRNNIRSRQDQAVVT